MSKKYGGIAAEILAIPPCSVSLVPLHIRRGDTGMHERILRLPEVIHTTGKSRSSVYESIADGLFPRPIPIGGRAIGFVQSEIAAWVNARIQGASDAEIRALVADLTAKRQGRSAA